MKNLLFSCCLVLLASVVAQSQESPREEDYYKIARVSAPEGILLEVGGMTMLPNNNLAIATRRGDIWFVENPGSRRPYFRRFALGLHEVLGLLWHEGSLYCAQRGELTKLTDTNHDGEADSYETVYAWPLSGHYHEYSFGPKLAPDGTFFVTTNVAFLASEWWRGQSLVPWRGWTLKISKDGRMEPWATGMRSPCGIVVHNGELFYADNQGDWQASGGLVHVKKGSFTGHPAGLSWTGQPGSPLKMTAPQLYSEVDPRRRRNEAGLYIKPENVNSENPQFLYSLKDKFPAVQTPAVWFPHGILGVSNSEIVEIPEGAFGPFAGQLLAGDMGMSKISRVFLEKVNGEYQGAAIELRNGFQSGVLRMVFAPDGSLYVGETNRGWGSLGDETEGLQRLTWTGEMPFEMLAVRAMPDGFEVEFTRPADRQAAEDLSAYAVESFLYKYQPVYGSPMVSKKQHKIQGVRLSEDGLKARILVDSLREHFIHKITLEGIHTQDGQHTLVHPVAWYTLNAIPDGPKLTLNDVSIWRRDERITATPKNAKASTTNPATISKPATADNSAKSTPITFESVKPLLTKYTCLACHQTEKRQVGPAFRDVAKRGYSNDKIVELIYNPQPENWPDYTEMVAMPQVPRADALRIAEWINSLKLNK